MALHWQKHQKQSGNCHIVGIDQIMMSPIELLMSRYQFGFLIPLAQQACSEHFPTLHEVLIIWTGSGITFTWNVNAVRWCRRDITAQEWKVNNGKIEVIPFVVKPSSKLSIVNVEITIQVWRGGFFFICQRYRDWCAAGQSTADWIKWIKLISLDVCGWYCPGSR